ASGFAHPSFTDEGVSVHSPSTKAIPQRRVRCSLCATIWPIRGNMEALMLGHALKYRLDRSGALKLGADTAQRVFEVLFERGGLWIYDGLYIINRHRITSYVSNTFGFCPVHSGFSLLASGAQPILAAAMAALWKVLMK